MKKLFYTLIAATALMACAKEADFNNTRDNEVINENGLVSYTFHAYFEDQTKASINESGKFSWGAAGTDQIAVWDATHSEFVTFTSTDNNGNFRCEAKPGASFNGQTAYYPASVVSTGSFVFPTSFASLEDAAKGFPMSGTVSAEGKIPFAHLGCLIKMTLNNVPSFTTALILNDGSNDITVTATPTDGVINAVVPIPAGTYILTVKLKDDNNNVFYTKARGSKEYIARKYYPINPIEIGYTIMINKGSWDYQYLQVWSGEYNGTNSYEFRLADIGGEYPYRLNTLKDGNYYVVLDRDIHWNKNDEKWLNDGMSLGVSFQKTTGAAEYKSYTECVYLCRNITFTPMANGAGGLKTNFRVYYNNSNNWPSVKVYVWGDIGVYVRWYNWGNQTIYYRATDKSSWGWGTATSNPRKVFGQSDYYSFYEVPSSYWNKTIEWFGIGGDGSAQEITNSEQKDLGKNQFFYKSDVSWGHDNTELAQNEVLSNAFPGDIVAPINGRYYYEFSESKYGYGYNLIFSNGDNSSEKTPDTHVFIGRDYTLPL